MEVYIKLSDAVNAIRANGVYGEGYSNEERENDVINTLESLPCFEFNTDKSGHWRSTSYDECVGFSNGKPISKAIFAYECSECGKIAHAKHNYCKACGIRMDD